MPYKTQQELEAEAAVAKLPPQPRSIPVWHFNPLTQRPKSPERYETDQRRLYVLERLKDVEPGAPNVLDPGPLRKQLASPIEPYAKPGYSAWDRDKEEIVQVPGQYLGEDSPIWKGLTWMGSPVSAVANASRELANQADRGVSYMLGQEPVEQYPGAWDNANKDFSTFTSALPRGGAMVYREESTPEDNRWQELRDMRTAQDSMSAKTIDPREADRFIQEKLYAPQQIDMVDMYEGAGLPPTAAWTLGTVGNIVADPGSAMLGVRSLVKQGRMLAAWKALGFDAGMGVAPEFLIQSPEILKQIRESGGDVTEQIRDLLPERY